MTTTPATTSASPSTSNDSPIQQQQHEDNNGASEMSIDDDQQQPPQPESPQKHKSSEKLLQQQSPPPSAPQSQQQQQKQQQLNQQRHHQQQKTQPQQLQQQQSSKKPQPQQPQANTIEQKRPMNAFLLFCKKQRSLVREKYPNLENRGITRILGDWWSKLDKEQKSKYTDQARQHKEAFMEANPDFKWCKTPITPASNNNNNSSSNTTNDDCYATNNRSTSTTTQESSLLSPPISVDSQRQQTSNSRDTFTNNIRQQQNEAPKPPKKRYLERNEPVYSKNNNSKCIDKTNQSNAKDQVVPYMQLDQDTLHRVIGEALSEKSNDSPTGLNMCKDSNRNSSSNDLASSAGLEPNPFTTSSTTIATSANSTPLYSNGVGGSSGGDDEPVDFSMKVTFRATNQLIIDNVIEKAYSGSVDIGSGTSRSGGTSSVHSQLGSSIRRVNTKET